MEAHRIADKQRMRLVGKVEQENKNGHDLLQHQMSSINRSIYSIQKPVQNFVKHQKTSPSYNNAYYQNAPANGHHRAYHRNWSPRNGHFRGGNPSQNQNQNRFRPVNGNYTKNQTNKGYFKQSNQGPGFRLQNQMGPKQ